MTAPSVMLAHERAVLGRVVRRDRVGEQRALLVPVVLGDFGDRDLFAGREVAEDRDPSPAPCALARVARRRAPGAPPRPRRGRRRRRRVRRVRRAAAAAAGAAGALVVGEPGARFLRQPEAADLVDRRHLAVASVMMPRPVRGSCRALRCRGRLGRLGLRLRCRRPPPAAAPAAATVLLPLASLRPPSTARW